MLAVARGAYEGDIRPVKQCSLKASQRDKDV